VAATNVRSFVPLESQPAQVVECTLQHRLVAALSIRILDAQHETAATPARSEEIEQRRARIAQVETTARAGRESGDYSGRRHGRASYRIERPVLPWVAERWLSP
jgi:hypothetical protein